MRIEKKRLDKWDDNTLRKLRYATLSFGYLKTYMKLFPKSHTMVAFSGKQVMGWIFILEHNGEYILSFFTNARYRKMGVATALAEEAIKQFSSIAVVRWDDASAKTFFKLKKSHRKKVTIYAWPANMPSNCGCAYCNCHQS